MNNIIILGATGTGKTSIAKELAGIINGEIISADSRQIYRYLDIGTNKDGVFDTIRKVRFTGNIPQHLTDIINPDETYSAGEFVKDSTRLIKSISKRGKTPVITGGTGLYIQAVVNGLAELPKKNEFIRNKYKLIEQKYGKERLYQLLFKVDSESAENNKSNTQRMIRALEVYELTKKPISELQKNMPHPKENFIQFGLTCGREALYEKLNRRCKAMLENGMIEEVKKMLSLGYSKSSPGLNGLGYKHIIDYIEGKISRKELIELFCRDTRHYAKRQVTWFKRDSKVNWIDIGHSSFNAEKTAHVIHKIIKKQSKI